MEPATQQLFGDAVKSEKQRAPARYNLVRRIVRLRQVLELIALFAAIYWSSARVPEVFGGECACFAKLYGFVFNHHVVFLIGNAIIVALCVLCHRSDECGGGFGDCAGDGDFYDDYVKHSGSSTLPRDDAAKAKEEGGELAESVAQYDELSAETSIPRRDDVGLEVHRCDDVAVAISPCDGVAEAIETASRQIKRFERTQSERLRRAIAPTRRSTELRRSETDIRRKIPPSSEIERLDGEEFRRAIDAFIDQHWNRKGAKQSKEYGEYRLVKVT